MYLIQQIEEVILQYNDARRGIGEFVLKVRSGLGHMSMSEVAQRTYTSKATLVRFAKTLGFSGWREFIMGFMEEVLYEERSHTEINPNFPFQANDSYEMIVNQIGILQTESISDTINLVDYERLMQAVDILLEAKIITIFCISPYIYLAEIFRRKMLSIGVIVEIVNPFEAGLSAEALRESDCAIVISYSGNNETFDPISHIKALNKRGVKIIGITSAGDNYIRRNIDCVLTMSSRERLYSKISNFATEESVLFILNILFSCYFKHSYQANVDYKLFTAKEIERRRTSTMNQIKET